MAGALDSQYPVLYHWATISGIPVTYFTDHLRFITTLLIVGTVGLHAPSVGESKIDQRLGTALANATPGDHIVAWVFFKDKGTHELLKTAVPPSIVSPRSLQRRMKARPLDRLVDYTDLPVEETYVNEVAARVIKVRQRTKWFNGVSVVATREQLLTIELLPFVRSIELVFRAKSTKQQEQADHLLLESEPPSTPAKQNEIHDLNYGPSLNQNQQINVPVVHNTGNYAQGVVVGVFDNGFRLLSHQAFDTLRPRIIAAYDFVSHDPDPAPYPGDPSSFGAHGVNTLSILGGYREGQLIGPAFGASYILARTENDSSETPIEEDNWAAAIEWADSIGVDVTSTSLGYLTYEPPYTSWTWQDMNGNTTVITRAADMAVARGIVVLNSAGNSGSNATRNTLGAPADGDSVLAVGALNANGTRASYSSVGPTTSIPPRFKPDVMAQGSSVWYASASNPTGYSNFASGTSFSCPLAAGAAALIVKARPNASAVEVGEAMRMTASNASSPNNLIGWGTINVQAAIDYLGTNGSGGGSGQPTAYRLQQNFPNPFNAGTKIRFSLPEPSDITLGVFDVLGRKIRTLVWGYHPRREYTVDWDGRTDEGSSAGSGVYFYRLTAQPVTAGTPMPYVETRKMILLQ